MSPDCPHRPYQYERRNGRWYCPECRRDVHDEIGSSGIETESGVAVHGGDDPDDIPEGMQYRHPLRSGSGFQEEKKEAGYRDDLRSFHVSGRRVDGRIRASIPVELYYGKIRQTGDRYYWQDPANVRKHKNWTVKE